MILRPFRAADLGALAGAFPVLEPDRLVRDFLMAPDFSAGDLLVAEVGGAIAGFVLAVQRDALGADGTGWIAAFGVQEKYRGRGIATSLLEASIAAMRRHGVTRVDVADVPVRYLLPGVDRAACPVAYRLLVENLGFAPRDEVASMGIDLTAELVPQTDPAIRVCRPGEYPLLRDFLCREFDPGWWAFYRRSLTARLSGDAEPADVICHWQDGLPLGAVHYRGSRFGPLAVSASLRGQGIGARLTHAALAGMRGHGVTHASFMIGAEAVQPFYARLGFHVLRRFFRLARTL